MKSTLSLLALAGAASAAELPSIIAKVRLHCSELDGGECEC